MEEPNSAIFTHAKMEYTNQLIETLSPQFFDGIKSIYDESKTVYKSNPNKGILLYFRLFLEKVPGWSNEIVEVETERIIMMSKCDWLDDLITAVFISHTKILTSIGTNPNSNIDLIIPKTINFIHKCYINIAREIWKNPYLYDDNVLGSDYQKNMRTVELIIKDSIENTIRKLLPVKEILKQHLESYENNSNENKKLNTNELRQMLLTELKNIKMGGNKENIQQIDEVGLSIEDDGQGNNEEEQEQEQEQDNMSINEEEIEVEVGTGEDNNNTLDITTNDNDDGYTSPDEETIKKNCENLNINDIPDVTEEKYDNIEIKVKDETNEDIDKESILKNYMESIETKDEDTIQDQDPVKLTIEEVQEIKPVLNDVDQLINDHPLNNLKENGSNIKEDVKDDTKDDTKDDIKDVVKGVVKDDIKDDTKDDIKDDINDDVKGDPLFSEVTIKKNDSEPSSPLESPKEENTNDIKEEEEGTLSSVTKEEVDKTEYDINGDKLQLKIIKKDEVSSPMDNEIISVNKDISDTETVDDFFNHVSEIMENKGVVVDKDSNKYTLFDDIVEEDN
tara:strand:+ start:2081 stop:3769 length:1689 start_codon:yes stop_codon:yes gene_type:complete